MGGDKRGGGGGGQGGGQRKRTKYYDKKTGGSLPPLGSRGFLVSCETGLESRGIQEALAVLNEYYEKLVPEADRQAAAPGADAGSKAAQGGGGGDTPPDFEAALAEEAAEIKDKGNKLFYASKTGVGGLIYVRMKHDAPGGVGPVQVAQTLMEDVAATKQNKTRHCMRFIPVEYVCEPSIKGIHEGTKKILQSHMPADGPALQFAVQFEHRASKSLDRMEVINSVVDAVPKVDPPHKVNLSTPDITFMVQVLKSVACVGGMPRYNQLGKYNIRSIINPPEKAPPGTKPAPKPATIAAGGAPGPAAPAAGDQGGGSRADADAAAAAADAAAG